MESEIIFVIYLTTIGAITAYFATYYNLKWRERWDRATDQEMYESYKEAYEKDPTPYKYPPEEWKRIKMANLKRQGRKWTK